MHEILTIQCGNAANYIGTHFWNLQDPTDTTDNSADIDHDVLFSAGQARNGLATYTPRLLIYDRAKNFGSMKRINALYSEPETPHYTDEQQVHQQQESGPRAPEHRFQQSLEQDEIPDGALLADSNVKFWSDYNTQFYRPESYLPLDSFASTNADWTTFDQGHEAFQTRDQTLDILDTDIRPFLEQCDLLQGFNIITDATDGWSGFSTALLIELATEFIKTSKCCHSATNPSSSTSIPRQGYLNTAQALLAVHDEVDAIIPLDSRSTWSGSARYGLWLDSLMVPFRSKKNRMTLSDVLSFLEPQHKLFSAVIDGQQLGQISGLLNRSFTIERGSSIATGSQNSQVLESRMIDSALQTYYRTHSSPIFPTAFPDDLRGAGSAVLGNTAYGSIAYMKRNRTMVAGIRGAKGYDERKGIVEELVELAGRYKSEVFGDSEDGSSDDDGF